MNHLIILVLLCLSVCSAYSLNGAKREEQEGLDMNFAQHYLENYYNLAKDAKQFVRRKDSSPVVKKIQEMQKFLGLEVTGKLDSDTMEVMHKPRCGVPDVGSFSLFPGMPKWSKTHLTYRIVKYTLDLPKDAVDSAIEKALKVWEEVTPLTFSRIYQGEADIMITFAVRGHGDFISSDGPGKVLAHAYPHGPAFYRDVHFDDDEQWTKDTSGTNLFLTAAHEHGHTLGLYHSANTEALRYPVYPTLTDPARLHLSQDDVNGIQSLYRPPPASLDDPEVLIESVHSETPDMCDPTLSFDAVSTLRGEILFFKDRYIWHRSLWSHKPEFQSISTLWPSLPSDLDTAYEVLRKDTVFIFKGFFYFFRGSLEFEFDPNIRMVTHILKSNNWLC